jgi:hypothetical protein
MILIAALRDSDRIRRCDAFSLRAILHTPSINPVSIG